MEDWRAFSRPRSRCTGHVKTPCRPDGSHGLRAHPGRGGATSRNHAIGNCAPGVHRSRTLRRSAPCSGTPKHSAVGLRCALSRSDDPPSDLRGHLRAALRVCGERRPPEFVSRRRLGDGPCVGCAFCPWPFVPGRLPGQRLNGAADSTAGRIAIMVSSRAAALPITRHPPRGSAPSVAAS